MRESNNFPGDYTLCVCASAKIEHYHIVIANNKLTIDEEEHFDNLIQLVEVRVTGVGSRLWGVGVMVVGSQCQGCVEGVGVKVVLRGSVSRLFW